MAAIDTGAANTGLGVTDADAAEAWQATQGHTSHVSAPFSHMQQAAHGLQEARAGRNDDHDSPLRMDNPAATMHHQSTPVHQVTMQRSIQGMQEHELPGHASEAALHAPAADASSTATASVDRFPGSPPSRAESHQDVVAVNMFPGSPPSRAESHQDVVATDAEQHDSGNRGKQLAEDMLQGGVNSQGTTGSPIVLPLRDTDRQYFSTLGRLSTNLEQRVTKGRFHTLKTQSSPHATLQSVADSTKRHGMALAAIPTRGRATAPVGAVGWCDLPQSSTAKRCFSGQQPDDTARRDGDKRLVASVASDHLASGQQERETSEDSSNSLMPPLAHQAKQPYSSGHSNLFDVEAPSLASWRFSDQQPHRPFSPGTTSLCMLVGLTALPVLDWCID